MMQGTKAEFRLLLYRNLLKPNQMKTFLICRSNVFMILLVFFIFSACTEGVKPDKDVAPPDGVITSKEAIELDQTYTRTRVGAIDSAIGKKDNRSSWWSIEDIKDYIAYAEQQANDQGYKLEGLRIYQGAFPENYTDQKLAGYGTVFIVPTGVKVDKQTGSFFNINMQGSDITGISPLDRGHQGDPPQASYPQ